jgi:hypothetical protein
MVAAVPTDEPPVKPQPISASPVVGAVATGNPERASEQPQGDPVKTERLAIVGVLEMPPEMPFRAPVSECVRLFHEGLDFACIALAHDTIDAILRLVCRVKLSPKQAKCADIRSQFGGLSAIGVLPTPLKTRLESLSYERVDYLELNPAEDRDRSALDGAVSNHISVLVELVRLFLGHASDHGKVLPDHAEYGNHGHRR